VGKPGGNWAGEGAGAGKLTSTSSGQVSQIQRIRASKTRRHEGTAKERDIGVSGEQEGGIRAPGDQDAAVDSVGYGHRFVWTRIATDCVETLNAKH